MLRTGQRLPRVIGHRGAGVLAPENTLAAFQCAAALGLAWVEFDVRLSGDGIPVLLHDPTLERTTNGSGAIAITPLSALRQLDAGGWFCSKFGGERLPTLAEAIECLGKLGLGANIEVKAEPGEGVATAKAISACLKGMWPPHLPSPLISSFDEAVLRAVQGAIPDVDRALIVDAVPDDVRDRLSQTGCAALHCAGSSFTALQAGALVGIPVRCYTINDREAASRLFALGVESVFSDRPDLLISCSNVISDPCHSGTELTTADAEPDARHH